MASQTFGPRKQRTRQHVIADLSVHHVEGFILEEGHTAQRLGSDYGYDLIVRTFDGHGYIEPGVIYFQFKAKEKLTEIQSEYVFDLDIRDYNLWIKEEFPVILILFDATKRWAFWLPIQRYFEEDVSRKPVKGAKTVRVRVPKRDLCKSTSHRQNARSKMKANGEGEKNMKRSEVTYGQLDQVLRSLGFTCQPSEKDPPGRIYQHKKTGALIKLPSFPDREKVLEYHMITVQGELENFGIADPMTLAAKFQKAG